MFVWVLVAQLCPILCNLKDYSQPSSSVHGILQARILELGKHVFLEGIFSTLQYRVSCIAGRFFIIWATREAYSVFTFCLHWFLGLRLEDESHITLERPLVASGNRTDNCFRVPKCSYYCCYHLVEKSCLTLVIPWTVACQTPLSIGFPRQEYWSELPFPSPGESSWPWIKTVSPALVDSLFFVVVF